MDILKVKQNGVWTAIPAIIGPRGIGITSITKTGTSGLTDTYTITFSDNTTTTFTLNNGAVPNLTIGTVTEGATAAATITGTTDAPVLNLVLPNANVPTRVSELENDAGYLTDVQINNTSITQDGIANIPIANVITMGVVKPDGSSIIVNAEGVIKISTPSNSDYKNLTTSKVASLSQQHKATFYSLAKAAGDTTQSQSSNAVGIYTNEAKAAIQTMLDVPSNAAVQQAIANVNTMKIHICAQGEYNTETGVPTIQNPDTQTFYLVPGGEGSNLFIEWAYVNSAWERFGSADVDLSNYVQKTDYATLFEPGVIQVVQMSGAASSVYNGVALNSSHVLKIYPATEDGIKNPFSKDCAPIVPKTQHISTFYGLASAAGDITQSQSDNAVGTYTDAAKTAIRSMLDVPATSDIPTKVSDLTDDSGHYTKPAGGIPASDLAAGVIPNVPVTDVQVAGSSVVGSNGIANIPIASDSTSGVVRVNSNGGIKIVNGYLLTRNAQEDDIKAGTNNYLVIGPAKQHISTFYGLSKAAGVDLANETVTLGTYPETSKTAIKTMLGVQDGLKVVRLI